MGSGISRESTPIQADHEGHSAATTEPPTKIALRRPSSSSDHPTLASMPRSRGRSPSNAPDSRHPRDEIDSANTWQSPAVRTFANIVPPFAMKASSVETGKTIDRTNSGPISPDYIESIRQRIRDTFPEPSKPEYSWQSPSSPYPEEDLKKNFNFYSNNHSYSEYSDRDLSERYNPYSFRMPHGLKAFDHWFNRGNIMTEYDLKEGYGFMPPGRIKEKDAKIQYFDFIKEYHLIYVDLLEAATGSHEAIAQIKNKINTDILYKRAGINPEHLKKTYRSAKDSEDFRYSMLAHLAIDALTSSDPSLSTDARVQIINVLHQNFDVEKLANAFQEHSEDLELEPVEDLIPKAFVTKWEEQGGIPHNELFLKNRNIQSIFCIGRGYPGDSLDERMNFEFGLSVLLEQHPKETVQTLLSFMRIQESDEEVRKQALHALLNLSQLDPGQKDEVFGIEASYRTDIQNPK